MSFARSAALVAVLGFVSTVAPLAIAQNFRISVTNNFGGPCDGATTNYVYVNQTSTVTLNLSTCARSVTISGWVNGTPDSTQDIPRIVLTGGPSAFPVDIGMGSFGQTDSRGSFGARHWGGLDASAVGGPNGKVDCCEPCYPEYYEDGNVDQDDIDYLTNVVAGGGNQTNHDPDFNRHGNVDQDDVAELINTMGGGGCP